MSTRRHAATKGKAESESTSDSKPMLSPSATLLLIERVQYIFIVYDAAELMAFFLKILFLLDYS